jgi:hypothetical protein
MKNYLFFLFLTVTSSAFAKEGKDANIFAYPMPQVYQPSTEFTLQVAGVKVPVVDYNPKYDYAHFSMSKGEADVSITLKNNAEVTGFYISPLKLGLAGVKHGNTLQFKLHKDAYLIIRINQFKELVIAADPEEKDRPASSGKGIFNVSASTYNADASGKSLSTKAIQKAIDDASAFHKGIVYVPAGIYKIGNINLKSNISLYLEGGAVFMFTGKREDYVYKARKTSQNRDLTWWIYTDSGAHDIKLYGRGTLDGNGKYGTEVGHIGNHILAIMAAKDFLFDGLIVKDSGAWGIIPTRSKNVVFRNIKIFNRFDMGENDGMDVMESENVLVEHGIGIALDDPFSTKTWEQNTDLCRNWPGHPLPQKHIVFDDLISWTYCYGYKVGQGVMQPQEDITFKNSVVYDAAVGIGIHHKWGTSYVSNVTFDHIDIEQLSYQNDDHRTWEVFYIQNGDKKGGGPISGITVKNIKVYDPGKSPGKVKGAGAMAEISNVNFRNIYIRGRAATSLPEMNVTDTLYSTNIKIDK